MSRESSPAQTDFASEHLEKLAAIELDFETAEIEILKKQTELLTPLYKKRAEVTDKIPTFWPRALASFPALDQCIQDGDAEVLESSLKSIDVQRPDANEIRSFDIIFKFGENDFFTNTELKKSFIYKALGEESRGIVSEPVKIDWKEGKDLTNGASKAAFDYYHAKVKEIREKGLASNEVKEPEWESYIKEEEGGCDHDEDEEHDHGPPKRSFFNWFSWWGSAIVFEKLKAALEKQTKESEDDIEIDDDDEDVYPMGEEVSQAIVKDLFPNASKFFTESIYGEGFEDDEELMDIADFEDEDDSEEEAPKLVKAEKKRKGDPAEKPADGKKKKSSK